MSKDLPNLLKNSYVVYKYSEISILQIDLTTFSFIGSVEVIFKENRVTQQMKLSYHENMMFLKNLTQHNLSILLKSEFNLLEISEGYEDLKICILTDKQNRKNSIKFKPTNILSNDNLLQYLKCYNIQYNFNQCFEKLDILGTGGYSQVHQVKDCQTEAKYAAKKISYIGKESKTQFPVQVGVEIRTMRDLQSENVPKLYEIFQQEKYIIIIMEYIRGCTLRMFIKHIKVNKKIAFCILWSLTQIIYKMHQKLFCHRDIKPLNIIIKDFEPHKASKFDLKDIMYKHRLYLIDYGLTINNKYENYNELKMKVCGTSGYMPPELLNTKSNEVKLSLDQSKFDIFSLGVIIYEMLSGRNPFISATNKETWSSNRKCDINFKSKRLKSLRESEISLVKSLLESDPNLRLGIEDLVTNSIVSSFDELIYNDGPNKVSEIMESKYFTDTKYKKLLSLNAINVNNSNINLIQNSQSLSIDKIKKNYSSVKDNKFNTFDETTIRNNTHQTDQLINYSEKKKPLLSFSKSTHNIFVNTVIDLESSQNKSSYLFKGKSNYTRSEYLELANSRFEDIQSVSPQKKLVSSQIKQKKNVGSLKFTDEKNNFHGQNSISKFEEAKPVKNNFHVSTRNLLNLNQNNSLKELYNPKYHSNNQIIQSNKSNFVVNSGIVHGKSESHIQDIKKYTTYKNKRKFVYENTQENLAHNSPNKTNNNLNQSLESENIKTSSLKNKNLNDHETLAKKNYSKYSKDEDNFEFRKIITDKKRVCQMDIVAEESKINCMNQTKYISTIKNSFEIKIDLSESLKLSEQNLGNVNRTIGKNHGIYNSTLQQEIIFIKKDIIEKPSNQKLKSQKNPSEDSMLSVGDEEICITPYKSSKFKLIKK